MGGSGEGGEEEEVVKRARLLLRYNKKARELGGSSRNEQFDTFVLTHRDYLKAQLRLCELAVQRILRHCHAISFVVQIRTGQVV